MVAATLVLLCTRPPEVAIFRQFPWLLTVPSIAIIGREVRIHEHSPYPVIYICVYLSYVTIIFNNNLCLLYESPSILHHYYFCIIIQYYEVFLLVLYYQ